MATATELLVAEELDPLREVAAARGWYFQLVDSTTFILRLPANDGSWVELLVKCDSYPTLPPAWHFRNPDTGVLDSPADTPRGGAFFHSNGVICAPWNRLAYSAHWSRGPHGDWTLGDWRANPQTGATKMLCAMALRIAVELQGPYEGRRG